MAVLLIIDENAKEIEDLLSCNVLYLTSHSSLFDAEQDFKHKQFDYALMTFNSEVSNPAESLQKIRSQQPDMVLIWLVNKEDYQLFEGLEYYKDELFLRKPFTKKDVIDLVGVDLIDQSQVDILLSKK